jgi:F-type H+-transporting ATPase subunit b
MTIDWFTVVAQLINFLVLVWLLQRFLYKPVLDAVDEREKTIANQLSAAADKEKAAEAQLHTYTEEREKLQHAASEMLDKARVQAGEEQERLIAEARKATDAQRLGWEETLQRDQAHYNRELVARVQGAVIGASRKLLKDLADTSLEANMATAFTKALGRIDDDGRQQLRQAITTSPRIFIRSSYPLAEADRQKIAIAIAAATGTAGAAGPAPTESTPPALVFDTDARRSCGIGLYLEGYKLEWSADDYLDQLETNTAALNREPAKAAAADKP